MKHKEVYQQEICSDCLQLLVNGESYHSEPELERFHETLKQWSSTGYTPAGMADEEPYFSWNKCDICNQLPGDRYIYNFFQESI